MTTPEAESGQSGDAVDQARAWLAQHAEPPGQAPAPAATSPTVGAKTRLESAGSSPDADEAQADPEVVARTIALRKLTAQARTRHELDQALRKKNVPDEIATTVLDRLEQVGLVDDAAFAQDWVE